jgi:hypothetical protein
LESWKEIIEKKDPERIFRFLLSNRSFLDFFPKEILRVLFERVVNSYRLEVIAKTVRGFQEEIPKDLKEKAILKIVKVLERGYRIWIDRTQERKFLLQILPDCPSVLKPRVIKRLLEFSHGLIRKAETIAEIPEGCLIDREILEELIPKDRRVPSKIIFAVISRKDCPKEIKERGINKLIYQGNFNEIFKVLPYLPDRDRITQIQRFLSKKDSKWALAILVRYGENLPISIKKKIFQILRSTPPLLISPFAQQIITEFLGESWLWVSEIIIQERLFENYYAIRNLLEEIGEAHFQRINGIPVFRDLPWSVCDIEKKRIGNQKIITGALLRVVADSEITQVLLLKDSRGSYAYRTHPRARTVKEAIAYGFQLDPSKFKGFVEEK